MKLECLRLPQIFMRPYAVSGPSIQQQHLYEIEVAAAT